MPDFSLIASYLPKALPSAGAMPGALNGLYGYLLAILLGLVIGSFLSVVVYRLPIMLQRNWDRELHAFALEHACESDGDLEAAPGVVSALAPWKARDEAPQLRFNLCLPGSACTHCGHRLRAWENIPLLSYAIQRGRCSACHAPIGWIYPAVESLTALLAVVSLWRFGASWQALCGFGFSATLLALAFIDKRTQLLPDSLTLPLLWAGLLVNLGSVFAPPDTAIIGAAAGYLSLWIVYWLFKAITGKEGMGYGDFKLFAAIGAWLGWQWLPSILFVAALTGALAGLLAVLRKRMRTDQPLPFGPFLATAALLVTFGDGLFYRWLGA
jgi:leader peptidase (prepilin peptidase)/N-methyltransferase